MTADRQASARAGEQTLHYFCAQTRTQHHLCVCVCVCHCQCLVKHTARTHTSSGLASARWGGHGPTGCVAWRRQTEPRAGEWRRAFVWVPGI